MNNKIIIAVIVVLLVIAGGFLFYVQEENTESDSRNDTMEAEEGMMMEQKDDDEMEDGEAMEGESEASVEGDVYVVDSASTSLAWSSTRIAGSPHTGTVPVSGSVVVKDDAFVSGDFTIDIAGLSDDDNNARFIGHVKSDDFFDTEQYPTASLAIKEIGEAEGDDNYTVVADLTIKGTTNEITIPAVVKREGDNIQATSEFSIDRTKWGITYDSGSFFSEIGDRAIKDEIDFSLNLVVTPQQN